MNNVQLRDYQKKAIASFFDHDGIGLFEMATGTGKTITALSCVNQLFESGEGRQFLVIVVPYLHLIDQWKNYFSTFNMTSAIVIAKDKQRWMPQLKAAIWNYKHGYRQRVIVIGSYKSIASSEFRHLIDTPLDHSFLLADECHNIGQPSFLNHPLINFRYRLGLSATPKRWQDEMGTAQVYRYFNEPIYTFTMEEAIRKQFLTPYEYHPMIVDLTEGEKKKYMALTRKLIYLLNDKEKNAEQITQLCIRRGRILKRATYKIEALLQQLEQQEDKRHTLIYCAEGEINRIISALAPLKLKVCRFNAELSHNERQRILTQFAEGDIDILVAIKCLDEGVDVPATKTAYFLASTSNPREFIQRRGRILRQSPHKSKAVIYDFVVLPKCDNEGLFDSIAKKEIPRCVEFSQFALNQYAARHILLQQLAPYHLDHYMELDAEGMKQFLEEKDIEF